MTVEIYSTPSCGQCVIAKNLLKSKNISYVEFTVGKDVDKSVIEQRCDCTVKSVPQIFHNSKYLGGLKELQAAINNLS